MDLSPPDSKRHNHSRIFGSADIWPYSDQWFLTEPRVFSTSTFNKPCEAWSELCWHFEVWPTQDVASNVSLPKQKQFNFELSKHLFCCLQLWNDISSSKVDLQWEAMHVYCIGFNKNNLCGLFEFAMLSFLSRFNNKKIKRKCVSVFNVAQFFVLTTFTLYKSDQSYWH